MTLISDETLWIFLLSSTNQPEPRHLYDVANGVQCLEKRGISSQNIKLAIDGDSNFIKDHIKQFTEEKYQISPSSELRKIVETSTNKNIVLFVNGHGCMENGISGANPIKPYDLLSSLRINSITENIIVYLGQCYAGIFNYIDVTKKPNTIIIGATNLYPSISCATETASWCANLFLLFLFEWILNPQDIDGDGKFTVMDSYKYAGARTNDYSQVYKGIELEKTIKILEERKSIKEKISTEKDEQVKLKYLLEFKAKEQELKSSQGIHYNNQEPWILNAIPAQKIEY